MAVDRNYIGIAMDLDVSSLKAGLSEANKQIQLANSEFKRASSEMDDWKKSTEGLKAKITQLNTVLGLQERKLEGMRSEYKRLVDSGKENTEEARRLKVQMNQQESAVNSTKKELGNYRGTLEKAEKGTIDLEKVTLRGGKAVEKAGNQAEEAGGGFTVLKGAVATFAGNVLTSLVNGCKNAVTSLLGLAESTREYRQTLATLEAGATDVGVSTDFIKDKFADLMGVFKDQDSVTEGLNNLLTAGFNEKSLDSITTALEGASLKWKDTLKFEGLSDSLQEWIGSGGANLTGNFAELLERMGYNLEEVQAQTAGMTDEQRRNYAVNILNGKGLDEVSKKYREQNKDMVEAQKANIEWQNTTAKAGAIIEPITTKLREGFTRLVEKILELTKGVDFEALGVSITNAFSYFIDEVIPKIVEGIQWIIDNKNILLAGIAAIGSAFLAWKVVSIIQGIITAFKAWQLATQGMTVAQRLLNLVMAANPIGIIISLIAGLVAAFVILWNKSDKFRQFWIDMWEGFKKVVGVVVEWIKKNWKTMLLFLVNPVAGVFKYLYDNFDGFRQFVDGLVTKIKNLFKNMWTGIQNTFNNVKSFFKGKVDEIVGAFNGIKEKFISTGENIVKGIWDGIKNGASWLKDKISGFAGDVAGWFKKTFKINSPSKLMADEVGLFLGEGIGEGLIDSLPYVKKDLSKFSNFVSGNLGNIKGGLSVGKSYSHTTPSNNNVGKGNTVVNAGMTVNYNGKLSRKELKRLETDNYIAIKTKLRAEGVF